jgi:hypothetical protein
MSTNINPNTNTTRAATNRTARLLGVVIALQALTLAGQWLGHSGPTMLPVAQAQLANPAAERQAMLDEQKVTNSKLDRLIGIFESGQLQVKVTNPDDFKGPATKEGGGAGNGAAKTPTSGGAKAPVTGTSRVK